MKERKSDVGIIVGRFQTVFLTEAHKALIETVRSQHDRVIIFLGLSACKTTQNDPLDFESRRQLIYSVYGDEITVLYIKDCPDDDLTWSLNLDRQIQDVIGPSHTATLYGSRDSFLNYYLGRFPKQELVQDSYVSATDIRKQISIKSKNSEDFRAGVVWATSNQFPKVYPCVDVAILDEKEEKLLLGKKEFSDKAWRFIGGFADPSDKSFEQTARREVSEEAGPIETGDLTYVGSFFIDDPRYRKQKDKIISTLFLTKIAFGRPEPGDDIKELKWFNLNEIKNEEVIPIHQVLLKAVKKKLLTKEKL